MLLGFACFSSQREREREISSADSILEDPSQKLIDIDI